MMKFILQFFLRAAGVSILSGVSLYYQLMPTWVATFVVASTVLTWLYYVLILYMAGKGVTKDNATWWQKALAYGFVLTDFFYNYTAGTIMFLQLPRWGELMFTERCRRTVKNFINWRGALARVFSRFLLNPPSQYFLGVDHVSIPAAA